MTNAKRSGKKINYRIFFKRGLFCLLFVYLCCLLVSQQFKFAKLSKDSKIVEEQIAAAKKEQAELNAELESIDSEDYLRRVIREKLGFTKPNEKVFVDASK